MTFDEYQDKAHSTSGTKSALEMCALGLNGESGEVIDLLLSALRLSGRCGLIADQVKKHKYHGHELLGNKICEELGDILWYVAEMATTLGFSLEHIAIENIRKLQDRYPEGFSSKRSINR